MIDFHCHMLPNLDDGADFWGDTIRMARVALEEGINGTVLTPHYSERKYDNTRDCVLEAFEIFQTRLQEENIKLNTYPGSEVALTMEVPAQLKAGTILTINDAGKYILLEPPFFGLTSELEAVLFTVQDMGITPILAHPERCQTFINDFDYLLKLIEAGILVQLNTSSLTTIYEPDIRNTAEKLITLGAVHLLGSDAHSADRRPPRFQKAKSLFLTISNKAYWQLLTEYNPRHVLKGLSPEFSLNSQAQSI
ncbi:MAG: CpsB/CapC family capsule biosynthesis tyrosine phosphatase [Carboxydocellales bacterium]